MSDRLEFRPCVNVPDEMNRDRLVARMRKIRADAVLDKNTAEYWNRKHPNEEPLDVTFYDAVIAWCDGRGPLPTDATPQEER